MDKLKCEGLDLTTNENPQTTIEEVQDLLCSIGENETASNLKNLIDFGKQFNVRECHMYSKGKV